MVKSRLVAIFYGFINVILVLFGLYNLSERYGLGIILLVISFVQFSLSMIFFYLHTKNYPKNDLGEYMININQLTFSEELDNTLSINFIDDNGIYVSMDGKIKLNLQNYILPRYYILAFLNRQFRYKEINMRKLPIICLFKRKLKIKKNDKYQNVVVNIISKNKPYRYYIIKNYWIKSSFLVKHINISNFWIHFIYTHKQELFKVVKIDESKYSKGSFIR